MRLRNALYLILIVLIVVQFNGCMAAYVGGLAADAIGGLEKSKIDAAVSPGVTREQLGSIKRIIMLFSEENAINEALNAGGLTGILSDNITLEMMKLGYECVEQEQIKKALAEQGIDVTGPLDVENALKAAKTMGVQAIITGNVKCNTSYKSSASLLSAKVNSTISIQSATLKILGAENGESLMLISINYKNGQKPDAAAKSMVKILKSKMDDPFGGKKKE